MLGVVAEVDEAAQAQDVHEQQVEGLGFAHVVALEEAVDVLHWILLCNILHIAVNLNPRTRLAVIKYVIELQHVILCLNEGIVSSL